MKQIETSTEARRKIKIGIDKVADIVKTTLGPRGRNVFIDKGFGSPVITNDGVSIANEIELEDPYENAGVQIAKEIAKKTEIDGTTTSIVLTQALMTEGLKYVETGINPLELRKGMEDAKNDVIRELKSKSVQITNIREINQVASISAESKEMGELVGGIMHTIGKDGVVTVEESQTFGLSKEIAEGMNFDRGYISPQMVTNKEKQTAEIKNPFILVTEKRISSINDILPILEAISEEDKKELVIVAEDVDGEALSTLILNKTRGILNVVAIKTPEFAGKTEVLQDIAALTGATISEKLEFKDLGRADKVVCSKDDTTIIGGKGDTQARVKQLKKQSKELTSEFEKQKISRRIAKLLGGVSIIKVGAASEIELKYIKDKLDDTIKAAKAAMEEGIVIGGGVALAKVKLDPVGSLEYRAGYEALLKAIKEPFLQIMRNAGGIDCQIALDKVCKSKGNFGYDAKTNSEVKDMFKQGIVDSLKVTRSALENAVSSVGLVLTIEAIITEKKPNESTK